MNYTVVLNGCSRTVQNQAGEMAAFIEANLGPATPGQWLFLQRSGKKDELAALSPAASRCW